MLALERSDKSRVWAIARGLSTARPIVGGRDGGAGDQGRGAAGSALPPAAATTEPSIRWKPDGGSQGGQCGSHRRIE